MRRIYASRIGAALLLALGMVGSALAAPTPVVVELFTSHGCSSCPPADALLRRLPQSTADDVRLIRLSEHVDYWDDLGWPDRFSDHRFTQRQRDYARAFGGSSVYTPQIVVNGRHGMVGSRENSVRGAIRSAVDHADMPVALSLASTDARRVDVTVSVGGSNRPSSEVWVALTQDNTLSPIGGGENRGRRLREDGVVRVFRRAERGATDANGARRYHSHLTLPDGVSVSDLKVAAFVQRRDSRAIVGAAQQPVAPALAQAAR